MQEEGQLMFYRGLCVGMALGAVLVICTLALLAVANERVR